MRLLPQSARGTWLLASAVWMGGCALAWWMVPFVPRAEWTVPEPSRLDFVPHSNELVTRTQRSYPADLVVVLPGPPPVPHDGPIRIWDAKSGRLLRTCPPNIDCAPSLDSQVPSVPPGTEYCAISGDSRVLAAAVRVDDTIREVGVWQVGSLRPLCRFMLPAEVNRVDVHLNSAGTVLAATLTDTYRNPAGIACWETATHRELLRVEDAIDLALSADGKTLLTIADPTGDDEVHYRLSAWDVSTGRERFALNLVAEWFIINQQSALLSPDSRTIAAPTRRAATDPFGNLARRLGLAWSFGAISTGEAITLFDTASGRELAHVSGQFEDSAWSPDSTLLATLDRKSHLVRIWDNPPRKPLTWFALFAAILTLPLAWLARRRLNRLAASPPVTPSLTDGPLSPRAI